MSKNTKDVAAVNKNVADADLLDLLLAQGGQELRLDRTMYSPEKTGSAVVAGFIVDLVDMPPIDQGAGKEPRPWQAYIILTTHATKGVDREDNVVDVAPGEEIVVPATFQIQSALARFARDPVNMHELAIQPKSKIGIGGGRNFWTYRVVATGKSKSRGIAYALTGTGPDAPTAALPNGGVYNTVTGEVAHAVG